MPGPTPLAYGRRPPRLLNLAPPKHDPPLVAPNSLTGTHLSRLLAAARLARRYHDIFPQHPEWLLETFDWQAPDAEEAFARMTETFLARVEEHLFPVMVDVWDVELDNALYYLEQIPIMPQGLEHWYYDDFDNYREPLALLLHIEHRQEGDDGSDTLQEAYPGCDFPTDLNLGRVAAGLRRTDLAEPLSGLVEAIAMVQCDCDNAWMDYSVSDLAEMGSHLPWDDPETVHWLRESWQEARPRLERVWALVDWCSPQSVGPPDGERFNTIADLLLQAYLMERNNE
jgi:hypothetical protein